MPYNRVSMSKNSFIGKNWKLLLNILTIIALIIFVYLIRDQLLETWDNLDRVKWWALLLIIPLQVWKYDTQARLYRSLFHIVGNKFRYRQMFETSLELNFINNVFPSGGVSGISYFGIRMRSDKVTAGKATLVQLMKLLMLFVSFEVLLLLGLFLVALEGDVNSLLLMLTVALSTLLFVGTVLFVYILGGKGRVHAFYKLIEFSVYRTRQLIFRKRTIEKQELPRIRFLLSELHNNFKTIKARYSELKAPFLWGMLTNVAEILTIYAVYVAFGEWVNIGAVILAYSVANFAGLVSVLPGGVGIYEALMTTVLVAAGIPVALSLSTTIMYRVLSSVVQLPIGYYYYNRTIKTGHKLDSAHV